MGGTLLCVRIARRTVVDIMTTVVITMAVSVPIKVIITMVVLAGLCNYRICLESLFSDLADSHPIIAISYKNHEILIKQTTLLIYKQCR